MKCAECGRRAMRFTMFYVPHGENRQLCDGCSAGRPPSRCLCCGEKANHVWEFLFEQGFITTVFRFCDPCADAMRPALALGRSVPQPEDPTVN